MALGRQTVALIQSASVRVLADEGQMAEFAYQYAGTEKSQDVQRELDAIRPLVDGGVRNGVLRDGKVFILRNNTGQTLPDVSVNTPAGTYRYGTFRPGASFEVGKLQVARNLRSGEVVTVFIKGYELGSFTVGEAWQLPGRAR